MKKKISLALALMMLLSLCACGAQRESYAPETPMDAAAPKLEMAYSADMAVAEEAMGGFAVANTQAQLSSGAPSQETPSRNPEKIIYSADVTLETTGFDVTVGSILNLVEDKYKGYIESSSINGANYYNISRGRVSTRSASYTIRVPSEHFNALMSELPTLGNVPYSHTYTENISARYYDTEARLTAYETQEQRLLEMLEIAETVEDIISIEEKLTELRYKIESLQSSLNNWDRQVSYSSIYLSVEEVEAYTPEASVQPSYGEKLVGALEDGLSGFVGFLGNAFIAFVGALPALAVLAAAVAALVFGIRHRKRKKAKASEFSEKN